VRGEIMRKFTIELDEMVCKWLEHIAEVTGNSVEKVIADGICNKIISIEDVINKSFTYSE